jgi:RNA polymerase sigma-70 factor, ECF subfamily
MAPAARSNSQTSTVDRFGVFYDEAFPPVYAYLLRGVLGDRSAAEDLVQETFTALVEASADGRVDVFCLPFVVGVARHKLVDYYRRRGREQQRLERVWAARRSPSQNPIDDLLRTDESPDGIVASLRRLSAEHRSVLVLKYLDELSVAEISILLERSLHATESLLARARRSFVEIHGRAQP